MQEHIYFLWLTQRLGIGTDMYKRLFDRFDSAEEIYYLEKGDFINAGFKSGEIYPLLSKSLDPAKRIFENCINNSIGMMLYGDPQYPAHFYDMSTPPGMLFYRGYIPNIDDNVLITMVGTRKMSEDGGRIAHRLAFDISSAGAIVVSGMASGIDSMCHRGALDAGGQTIAFLGGGANVIYPPENEALYEQIRQNGAIVSEYFPDTEPKGTNFPLRNRLMAAVSHETVVVEAPIGSGALITAFLAKKEGKKVYAVPGSPTNPMCEGSNRLIQGGDAVMLDAFDVLAKYEVSHPHRILLSSIGKKNYYISGKEHKNVFKDTENDYIPSDISSLMLGSVARSPDGLIGREKQIYQKILSDGVVSPDSFMSLGITPEQAEVRLASLIMDGYVEELPGGLYTPKNTKN